MTTKNADRIQRALSLYDNLQLLRRQLRCMTERDVIDECVNSWLKQNIPEGARWPDEE